MDGVARTLRLAVVRMRSPTWKFAVGGSVVALAVLELPELLPAASYAETV